MFLSKFELSERRKKDILKRKLTVNAIANRSNSTGLIIFLNNNTTELSVGMNGQLGLNVRS